MTPTEIQEAVSADASLQTLHAAGDYAAIAATLPTVTGSSISVEDMFDALFASGDWVAIKMAVGSNNSATAAFSILSDAKTLGPGMVNLDAPATQSLLSALSADGLLSQPGLDAINAKRPVVKVTWQEVHAALES